MAQVILIENNQTLFELLSINLTTFLGVELIPRQTAQDAISLLSILPNVDLIISRNNIEQENTAQVLADYIHSNKLSTGLIVLGKAPESIKEVATVFESEKEWEKIIQTSAKILGINQETLKDKILPDYVPIPATHFLQLSSTNCDVYIRVKKGPEDYQYVRRIKTNDHFTPEEIQNYIDNGLTNFYVSKDFQDDFAIFLSNQLVTKLEQMSFAPEQIEQNIEAIGNGHQVLVHQINKIGFTSSTTHLTEVIINSMIETVGSSPQTSSLLHKIINSKTSMMYQHCFLISVVASRCVKHLKSEAIKLQEILTWASFFHDMNLTDDEELIKIHSAKQLEALLAKSGSERHELVYNHALNNSILVSKFPDIAPEIETIVKEHHGDPNGEGFADSPNPDISFLSKVFIVAEEFAICIAKQKENIGKGSGVPPKPIIKDLYAKFKAPHMVEIIKMLEENLKQAAAAA